MANLLNLWGTITRAASTTTLTNPSGGTPSGTAFTAKATVTPTPTGGAGTENVALNALASDGTTILASMGPFTLTGGVANISTNLLPPGTASVVVTYGGDVTFDANNNPILSTASQNVTYGSPYILQAAVIPSSGPYSGKQCWSSSPGTAFPCPTGTVAVTDNGNPLNDWPNAGTPNATNAPKLNNQGIAEDQPIQLPVGSHSIVATCAGDPNYQTSTSNTLSVTVAKAATTTTVSSSVGTITSGATVTLTALVTTPSNGAGPTGNVTFTNGSATLGTGACMPTSGANNATNGTAFCTTTIATNTLPTGSNSITAAYTGDTNYSASTGGPITVTVNKNASTTTFVASSTQVQIDTNVIFTPTVTGPMGGALIPTGNVMFLDGTTQLGAGLLNTSGIATSSTTALGVGSHSITAQYGGGSNFHASTSASTTVTVVAGDFSLSPSGNITVKVGGSGGTTITVTPTNGFNQQVSFTCTGLPAMSSCSFQPVTLTPNGSAASSVLTISTMASSGMLFVTPGKPDFNPLFYGLAMACLLSFLFSLRRTTPRQFALRLIPVSHAPDHLLRPYFLWWRKWGRWNLRRNTHWNLHSDNHGQIKFYQSHDHHHSHCPISQRHFCRHSARIQPYCSSCISCNCW